MDYEKKYKEALEKARQLSAYPVCWPFLSDLQDLFPELVESEDKKIREAIYNCVKWFGFDSCFFKDVSQEECLGWIEKQGEKKPILDVEIPFGAKDSELEEVSYNIPNGYHAEIEDDKVVIKKGKQKPSEWSKEDEKMFSQISDILWEGYKNTTGEMPTWDNIREWCLSLKDRVQSQPRQEYDDMAYEMARAVLYDKLKDSLRPQSHWKPSDAQMKQLGWIAEQNKDNMIGKELMTLYQDLKKLREE